MPQFLKSVYSLTWFILINKISQPKRIYGPLGIFHKLCVYIRCIFFLPSKGVDSSPESQKSQYATLRNTNILVVTSVLFCVDFLT